MTEEACVMRHGSFGLVILKLQWRCFYIRTSFIDTGLKRKLFRSFNFKPNQNGPETTETCQRVGLSRHFKPVPWFGAVLTWTRNSHKNQCWCSCWPTARREGIWSFLAKMSKHLCCQRWQNMRGRPAVQWETETVWFRVLVHRARAQHTVLPGRHCNSHIL